MPPDVLAWLKAITEVSYPILISLYLLIKVNTTLDKLRLAVQDQTLQITVGFKILFAHQEAEREFDEALSLARAEVINDAKKGGSR